MYRTGTYAVSSPPDSEPLTLSEVKLWLKVDGSTEDDLLNALITAARQSVEKYCQLALLEQEIEEVYPEFSGMNIRLSVSPLVSVDEVAYLDTGEVERVLDDENYRVDAYAKPPQVWRKENTVWPLTYKAPDAVKVTYTAGYETAADIPGPIKTAMLLMIADWYDNRTDNVRNMPTAAQLLLNQYRVWTF